MSKHIVSKQYVDLSQVRFQGKILDVGGGGEGVISRHSGDSIIAIDWRKDELEETANIGIKIVMDACNMTFLNEVFDNVTSFYTCMYMSSEHMVMFIKEAYRVLKPNGLLWIWDTEIPLLNEKDIFIVPLEIKLNSIDIISTGYGIGWSRVQTMVSLQKHLTDAGFIVEKSVNYGTRFELCCRK